MAIFSYLPRGGTRNVHLIAINPQARATAVDKLVLARIETRYVSVLMRQQNGTYKYESRRKETTLEEQPLAIAASGFESAAGHRRARQLRVRGARRAGRAAGALRLSGRRRRQRHARAGEERRAGAGAVEARLRAGRGDRAFDPRAVLRRRA